MSRVQPEQAQTLAREVLNLVRSSDVRLAELEVDAKPPVQNSNMRAETSLALGVNWAADFGIVCASRYEVIAEPVSGEDEETVFADDQNRWRVLVEMHGLWQLSDHSHLSSQNAQAFHLAVGAMTLHAYARSQIQSAIVAAGYPPFNLPMMHSLVEPGPEGLVNLDLVTFSS